MIRLVLFFILAATPDLFDPGYLSRPLTPQSEPPVVPLASIVAPSSSAPALVSWGESFTVTVLLFPGVDAGRAEEWAIWYTTDGSAPGAEHTNPRTARNTLHFGADKPSALVLPVIY